MFTKHIWPLTCGLLVVGITFALGFMAGAGNGDPFLWAAGLFSLPLLTASFIAAVYQQGNNEGFWAAEQIWRLKGKKFRQTQDAYGNDCRVMEEGDVA